MEIKNSFAKTLLSWPLWTEHEFWFHPGVDVNPVCAHHWLGDVGQVNLLSAPPL